MAARVALRRTRAHEDAMEMDLAGMRSLREESVCYIVVHTADFGGRNCDAEMVNRWHVHENGWPGIGYHFVILNDRHTRLPDGLVQPGRPLSVRGAHVKGINHQSIGICCTGRGDVQPFTAAQMESLSRLVPELMRRFDVPLERVIGHREVNSLIDAGLVPERDARNVSQRTTKTCPGRKVDMAVVRDRIAARILAERFPRWPRPSIVAPPQE